MMYVRAVKDINFLAIFPNPGPWGSLEVTKWPTLLGVKPNVGTKSKQ